MRGKDILPLALLHRLRITPAYAGKSELLETIRNYYKDHPRVCGEKGVENLKVNSLPGSPPRMRGKVRPTAVEHQEQGITPAYAGKSLLLRR